MGNIIVSFSELKLVTDNLLSIWVTLIECAVKQCKITVTSIVSLITELLHTKDGIDSSLNILILKHRLMILVIPNDLGQWLCYFTLITAFLTFSLRKLKQ